MALLRLLIGSVLIASVWASPAWAENVVVVLDRGTGAKERAGEDSALALRLVQRCQERGDTVRAFAVGARANGKPRVWDFKSPLDAEELGALDGKEGVSFEGPSDARAALATALRGSTPKDPLVVVFVGPFGRVEPVPEGAGFALDTWNRTAPEGSRLIPLSLASDARQLLESARGLQASGAILFGIRDPKVEAEPWSAFDPEARLRAKITASLEVVTWGGAILIASLAATGTEGDTVVAADGALRVERGLSPLLATTLALRARAEGAWDLSGDAAQLPVRWEPPQDELRWVSADGKPPFLEILDLERGTPREARFRYRRTAPPAATQFHQDWERDGGLVSGRVEGERELSPFLVEGDWVMTAQHASQDQIESSGETTIGSSLKSVGRVQTWIRFSMRFGWHVRSAPGRVRARLTAPDASQALPPAATDLAWDLQLTPENRNAPEQVYLTWRTESPLARKGLVLRLRHGDGEESEWRAGEAQALRSSGRFKVRLLPTGDDPQEAVHGSIVLEGVPHGGVEVAIEGRGAWRSRRPRLLVEPGAVQYRMGARDTTDERPLRLTLDADGGDGPWLARLMERTPTVAVPSDAPQAFAVVAQSPGRWEVRREGEWRGKRAGIFDDREERVPLTISWAGRAEPQLVKVTIVVPARWGRMGWVLVVLAGGALLLIVFTLASHRAEPITGTLLYTIQGVGGAVGRLPLASVGRRRTPVVVDARGRLALGGEGTTLFHLKPTRVGGMAEVPTQGGSVERRLLVDGLSFSVGRHALRHVQAGHEGSAAPPDASKDAPDLLGPEYDLPDPDIPRTMGGIDAD